MYTKDGQQSLVSLVWRKWRIADWDREKSAQAVFDDAAPPVVLLKNEDISCT